MPAGLDMCRRRFLLKGVIVRGSHFWTLSAFDVCWNIMPLLPYADASNIEPLEPTDDFVAAASRAKR